MFYDQFVKLCKERGLSPAAAARNIGLSNSSTTTWKRGAMPKGETLQKLADYFAVPVDYLLGNNFLSSLSDAELDELAEKEAPTPEEIKRSGLHLHISLALEKLNLDGLKKARERVEELTEIPRYQAKKEQE